MQAYLYTILVKTKLKGTVFTLDNIASSHKQLKYAWRGITTERVCLSLNKPEVLPASLCSIIRNGIVQIQCQNYHKPMKPKLKLFNTARRPLLKVSSNMMIRTIKKDSKINDINTSIKTDQKFAFYFHSEKLFLSPASYLKIPFFLQGIKNKCLSRRTLNKKLKTYILSQVTTS